MIGSLGLKIVLLATWLAGLCNSVRVACDQDDDVNYFSGSRCKRQLPNCLEYEYVPDSQNPGRYIFKCLTCTEGMVPYWTFDNVSLTSWYEDEEVPDKELSMCVPNSEGKPVRCTSSNCFKTTFIYCSKYVVLNPVYNGPNTTSGLFRCLECEEHFEPLPTPVQTTYYEFARNGNVTRLCTRKQGIFPCGTYCQAEFPGCARIQISKVQGGSGPRPLETATFRCLEAMPGYILLDQNVVADTMPFDEPKLTTLPVYTSDLKKCDSKICQSILPNCELYFKEHKDNMYETYYCKKCKATMEPVPEGAQGLTEILQYFYYLEPLKVCKQVALSYTACDDQCKLEFPGCDILSASDVSYSYSNGSNAVFSCNKCAEGFIPYNNGTSTPSWYYREFAANIKIVCIPNEARQPTPVRGEMTSLLPKCLQYTSKVVPNADNRRLEYTCVQCEQGWESVGPVEADWYSQSERFVCRHIALSNPVECNDDCKQNFPNCNRLMISRGANNTAVYQCLECSNGFYPIPYEREVLGRLSVSNNPMIKLSKIFLCSDLPNDRYFKFIPCVGLSLYNNQTMPCATDDNCTLIVYNRVLSKGFGLWKCAECKPGYRIKSPAPWLFGADPTFCEKVTVSSESGWSKPSAA